MTLPQVSPSLALQQLFPIQILLLFMRFELPPNFIFQYYRPQTWQLYLFFPALSISSIHKIPIISPPPLGTCTSYFSLLDLNSCQATEHMTVFTLHSQDLYDFLQSTHDLISFPFVLEGQKYHLIKICQCLL